MLGSFYSRVNLTVLHPSAATIAQRLDEVACKGRAELHEFSRRRMQESKRECVQKHSLKTNYARTSPILGITGDGQARCGKVHTNLVRSSRIRSHV